jgi:hypothetical protein
MGEWVRHHAGPPSRHLRHQAFQRAPAEPQSLKRLPRSSSYARPRKVRPGRPPTSSTPQEQPTRAAARAYVECSSSVAAEDFERHLTRAWTLTGRGRRLVAGLVPPDVLT